MSAPKHLLLLAQTTMMHTTHASHVQSLGSNQNDAHYMRSTCKKRTQVPEEPRAVQKELGTVWTKPTPPKSSGPFLLKNQRCTLDVHQMHKMGEGQTELGPSPLQLQQRMLRMHHMQ